MFAFLNTPPKNLSLSSAIQQLDKIATDVEDKKFEAVALEDKAITTLREAKQQPLYPSYNYLLAIHHCRIGYLFAASESWNEAVKHFTKGLDTLDKIENKKEIERAQIVFFSHVFFIRGLYLQNYFNNRDQAIASYAGALKLIQGIKIEDRTMADVAYQVFYCTTKLMTKFNVNPMKLGKNYSKNLESYADGFCKFLDAGVENGSLPRIMKYEVDLKLEVGDEANKARDLFRTVSDSLPEFKQSSLQGNSLFNNSSSSHSRVAITEQKKSEFTYNLTIRS